MSNSSDGDPYVIDPAARRLAVECVVPPIVVFVVSLYLINFTTVLDGRAAGPVTWAALVAVGQFVIAIGLGHFFLVRAEVLDADRPREGSR